MPNRSQQTFNKPWRFRPRKGRHLEIGAAPLDVTPANNESRDESIATAAPPPAAPAAASTTKTAAATLGKRRRHSSRINKRNKRPRRVDERLIIESAAPAATSARQKQSVSVAAGTATKSKCGVPNAVSVGASNGQPTGNATGHTNGSANPAPSGATSDVGVAKKGRRRPRRAPKRKWKPYFKLTNDERRLQEIREEKRAERVRAQRFKSGLPVAPYNTTQFLFNDLQARGGGGSTADKPMVDVDSIVESIRHHHRSESNERDSVSISADGSHANNNHNADGGSDSGSMGYADFFNEKEFDNQYDSAFVERLSSLSKDDLIKDYLELEKQYERGQSELLAKDQEILHLKQEMEIFKECVSRTT